MIYSSPIKIFVVVLSSVSLFSNCRVSSGFQGLTSVKPNKSDLVGTWVPDQATIKDMRERGGYNISSLTKLVLKDDGKLEIFNMPDWWESISGSSKGKMETSVGDWELHQDSSTWNIVINYPQGVTFLNLLGNKPPYSIEINLGDPDSGNEMIFVRSHEK